MLSVIKEAGIEESYIEGVNISPSEVRDTEQPKETIQSQVPEHKRKLDELFKLQRQQELEAMKSERQKITDDEKEKKRQKKEELMKKRAELQK